MTREEAIRHIGDVINIENNSIKPIVIFEQEKEALYMAIEALQNLSKPNNGLQGSDLISRQDAIDAMWKALYEYEDELEQKFIQDPDVDYSDYPASRLWVQNGHDVCLKAILSLPSADRPIGWTPASEALPIKDQVVLDIDDKETWGDKGTWDVDKQRGW